MREHNSIGVSSYASGLAMQGSTAPCKRDFEGEIKRLREGLEVNKNLLDAIMEYRRWRGGGADYLAELLGRMTMEVDAIERHINSLIVHAEKAQSA